jgi:hypothetical protein
MSIVGLSASDVFLITKLTARIISALREERGAKSQYQEAVRSLESLRHTLLEIQELSSSTERSRLNDLLKTQIGSSIDLISGFTEKIAKYEKHLGAKPVGGHLRGSFRKAQWAIRAARDLDDFRKLVTPQLEVIKLILSKETM